MAVPTEHVTSVPLCDLSRQTALLEPLLLEATQRVLRSGRFILGPEEAAFTTELAHHAGARRAVGVASGTDALVLALRAAGVRPGDRVITTPFSFFATAEAILIAGGHPVFADIDPVTFTVDPVAVQAILRDKSTMHRRVGVRPDDVTALVPVHLFGHPADVPALVDGDAPRVVIEDAAQALGGHLEGRSVGTLGTAGCFSFFPSKNLGGFGDGGAVLTDDAALADAVTTLRAHGASRAHHHEQIGCNSRLDELQAALLRIKLGRLDAWITRRRAVAGRYRELLDDVPGIILPEDRAGGGHSYGQYTIRVSGERRDDLRRSLSSAGVSTAVYYPVPLHLQPALRFLGYRAGDLPMAERAAREVLSLPMFPELTDGEVATVAAAIRAWARW